MGIKEYRATGGNAALYFHEKNDNTAKDGDVLLELLDFIKSVKNIDLQNKAYSFYDKNYKTLRQKAIDYFAEKTPDSVNAFAQEFVANIFSRTIDGCINSQFEQYWNVIEQYKLRLNANEK